MENCYQYFYLVRLLVVLTLSIASRLGRYGRCCTNGLEAELLGRLDGVKAGIIISDGPRFLLERVFLLWDIGTDGPELRGRGDAAGAAPVVHGFIVCIRLRVRHVRANHGSIMPSVGRLSEASC